MPEPPGGPTEALLETLPEPSRSLLRRLRDALLSFGGVSERWIVDYEVKGESPAFYVGARQLCHVHAGEGLEVTISLSRQLTFQVLRADVPEPARGIVERTKEYGATRWVSVPIASDADLESLVALAGIKYAALTGGSEELAVPRDQRTLEQFA